MRGELPRARLSQIGATLPSAVTALGKAFPRHTWPFLGSEAATEESLRGLWDGWHLLCEGYSALFEADACWAWYMDLRKKPNELLAQYTRRYYLDDAALRITASSRHLLMAIKAHFRLKLEKGKRRTQLCKIMEALKKNHPNSPAHKCLQTLSASEALQACEKYRNAWVHNKRPGVIGLPSNITFAKLIRESGVEGFSFGSGASWDELTLEELRRTCREAYLGLLRVYLKIIKIVSPKASELHPFKRTISW